MLSKKQQQRAELVDTYWQLMRSGETNTSACRVLGMSRRSGTTIRRAHQYQTRVRAPRVVWSGRYLDVRERLQIADLLRLGFSVRRIAAELGRHPSTIKRELDRHRSPEGRYLPRTADHDARQQRARPRAGKLTANITDVERARLGRMANFLSEGNGYFGIQSTRPQTLSFALTDSPVGQLTWIIEKFKEWTGSEPRSARGGRRSRHHPHRRLLLLVHPDSGVGGEHLYESVHGHDWPTPSQVPTGVAVCRGLAIRRYAEQGNNVVHWSDIDAGGHFAALETPDLLVADVRAFFAGLGQTI